MTSAEADALFAKLKQNPQDDEGYWTLVRHYEHTGDVKGLVALRLYYIEHAPDGRVWPGNLDPRLDRAGYGRGKALWLAHLKRPNPHPEIYNRAVDFLEGDDKPLAGAILEDFRKAYPNDSRVPAQFGHHYAQTLLGSAEPLTEFNVFRASSRQATQSAYAQTVRAKLSESTDPALLAQTAQSLINWNYLHREEAAQLARGHIEHALSIDPNNRLAQAMKLRVEASAQAIHIGQLVKMSPADRAKLGAGGRMLLALTDLRAAAQKQNQPADSSSKARALLDLAAQNPKDPLYGEAIYEANIVLGKVALWSGDKATAKRYLLAAADTPGSDRLREFFEMKLPRTLVDWGERSAVAQFLEKMAPNSGRPAQLQEWPNRSARASIPICFPRSPTPVAPKVLADLLQRRAQRRFLHDHVRAAHHNKHSLSAARRLHHERDHVAISDRTRAPRDLIQEVVAARRVEPLLGRRRARREPR
jgi:hypothetical protein